MKVLIVDNFPSFTIDIYVYGDHMNQVAEYNSEHPHHLDWLPFQEGTIPERPTLSFGKEVWAAIMEEALGPAPSEEVLKDTRMVRDRLLALIEKDHERMEKQADVMFNHLLGS